MVSTPRFERGLHNFSSYFLCRWDMWTKNGASGRYCPSYITLIGRVRRFSVHLHLLVDHPGHDPGPLSLKDSRTANYANGPLANLDRLSFQRSVTNICSSKLWCSRKDSNLRCLPCQGSDLATNLRELILRNSVIRDERSRTNVSNPMGYSETDRFHQKGDARRFYSHLTGEDYR